MTAQDVSRVVDDIVRRLGSTPDMTVPILRGIQAHFRYLPSEALRRVCEITDISPARITGVASFYPMFRTRPTGRHLIRVCHGTACHVKGAELVHEAIARHVGISADGDTDADGEFTLEKVACLGCCTLAPVMQIDHLTYGHLTPDGVCAAIEDFRTIRSRPLPGPPLQGEGKVGSSRLAEVRIGLGSCCVAGGSLDVRNAIEEAVAKTRVNAVVKTVGCVGMCHRTPVVEIVTPDGAGTVYTRVSARDAQRIVSEHFGPRGILGKMVRGVSKAVDGLLTDEVWDPVPHYSSDTRDADVCAFTGPQIHIATEHSGELDPLDLDSYIASGGFAALRKALAGSREDLIDAVKRSGLRGRGGAGFPTGEKWAATLRGAGGHTGPPLRLRPASGQPPTKHSIAYREESGTPMQSSGHAPAKYVVCNGDEGDPGAFMDRMLLESYPYRVLEGMMIAGYAIGAQEGHLHIRSEYPLALSRIRQAIAKMRGAGLLGEHIAGSDYSLQLVITEGAGAFVSGEETALIGAIEGRRASPRVRPPYPSEQGLWGKPTLVNNVETYALVPWIVRNGPEAFASIGTAQSKGTKVFALAGKVVHGGLIEVPMGCTIRQIVEQIGGGVAPGRTFKAVQIGGPSGGCIPAALADTPISYESLTTAGAIMGSGGLVVIDDTDCMVEIARYFLEFATRESCGKCTFCRLGTRRMLDIMESLCAGNANPDDLAKLEDLAHAVKRASLCGLGQTAPNPVLSTLRYFREEYEAHVSGKCPAGRCRALIQYRIQDCCIGCAQCARKCPVNAIEPKPYERHEIDQSLCIKCGSCRDVCPVEAVKVD